MENEIIENLNHQNKKLLKIIEKYDNKFEVLEQKLLRQELLCLIRDKNIFKCDSHDRNHKTHIVVEYNKNKTIKKTNERYMNRDDYINHIMYECPCPTDYFKKFRCDKKLI
tara:strand:+ start:205 stop:537 length:333 start_codon:yes stop_codon:yes gene_type:complete